MTNEVEQLHRAIDALARTIAERNEGRLHCHKGCSGCCVDGITVFEVEAERIRRTHATLLEQGRPHADGACAFLDEEGACRIYDERPYVCRTQGLPLRWLDEEEGVERRDICWLNEAPIAGDWPTILDLPDDACWPLGPAEERLRELQAALSTDDPLARVRLRDLFQKG